MLNFAGTVRISAILVSSSPIFFKPILFSEQTLPTKAEPILAEFNISYLDSYKTKHETGIAILPIGYLEGYNVTQKTDMFRTVDKLRRALREIKNIFKKQKLTTVINQKRYDVIGTIRNVPYNCRY